MNNSYKTKVSSTKPSAKTKLESSVSGLEATFSPIPPLEQRRVGSVVCVKNPKEELSSGEERSREKGMVEATEL